MSNTPVATTYTAQGLYSKYQKNVGCDCGNDPCTCEKKHDDCDSCKDEECGCCPTGLIEVKDANDDTVGCMTPNDAELYFRNVYKCQDSFVKVFDSSGNFVGCMTVADYKIYIAP